MEKKKKQMLKPSFNFDRLEEEACFHRQGIVKICLSPHHMASNEPDTSYSSTGTYLDFLSFIQSHTVVRLQI